MRHNRKLQAAFSPVQLRVNPAKVCLAPAKVLKPSRRLGLPLLLQQARVVRRPPRSSSHQRAPTRQQNLHSLRSPPPLRDLVRPRQPRAPLLRSLSFRHSAARQPHRLPRPLRPLRHLQVVRLPDLGHHKPHRRPLQQQLPLPLRAVNLQQQVWAGCSPSRLEQHPRRSLRPLLREPLPPPPPLPRLQLSQPPQLRLRQPAAPLRRPRRQVARPWAPRQLDQHPLHSHASRTRPWMRSSRGGRLT